MADTLSPAFFMGPYLNADTISSKLKKKRAPKKNQNHSDSSPSSSPLSSSPTSEIIVQKAGKNPLNLRNDFESFSQKFKYAPDSDDSEEDFAWEEPKRLVGFPYTNFRHKTVDDLIKEKVNMANKKMKEELERKEENKYNFPSFSPFNSGTNSPTKTPIDRDEEELSNDLTELLKDRLSEASQVVNKAKEATVNPELRQNIRDSKVPLGFEDISEDEKGPFFNEIIEFLNPFLSELIDQKIEKKGGLDTVIIRLSEHFDRHKDAKNHLMNIMNVKRLVVPYISLDLPGDIILTYNKLEENDPLVSVFRLHPVIGEEVYKFGIFLDRYDTNKEVICSLVWSTIDNMVICLPMVGLNPYPVCWHCEKSFGTMTCSKCGVAKYCSKECQVSSWKASHKNRCREIQYYAEQHKHLVFE